MKLHEAIGIARQMAQGLGEAHGHGIVTEPFFHIFAHLGGSGATWRHQSAGFGVFHIHSEPLGPCFTSRIRWLTPKRSVVLAPPWPSKMMRLSVMVRMPPI